MKNRLKDHPEPSYRPKDGKNSPWNFTCPQYDERSSSFVNAGTKHGVGYRNPVGTEKAEGNMESVIPFGRVQTMRVDEAS